MSEAATPPTLTPGHPGAAPVPVYDAQLTPIGSVVESIPGTLSTLTDEARAGRGATILAGARTARALGHLTGATRGVGRRVDAVGDAVRQGTTEVRDKLDEVGTGVKTEVGKVGAAVDRVGGRVDALGTSLGGKVDALGTTLGGRIDTLGRRLGRRLAPLIRVAEDDMRRRIAADRSAAFEEQTAREAVALRKLLMANGGIFSNQAYNWPIAAGYERSQRWNSSWNNGKGRYELFPNRADGSFDGIARVVTDAAGYTHITTDPSGRRQLMMAVTGAVTRGGRSRVARPDPAHPKGGLRFEMVGGSKSLNDFSEAMIGRLPRLHRRRRESKQAFRDRMAKGIGPPMRIPRETRRAFKKRQSEAERRVYDYGTTPNVLEAMFGVASGGHNRKIRRKEGRGRDDMPGRGGMFRTFYNRFGRRGGSVLLSTIVRRGDRFGAPIFGHIPGYNWLYDHLPDGIAEDRGRRVIRDAHGNRSVIRDPLHM